MATWIIHLRIADSLIKAKVVPHNFRREFIYGSLAPDCGYGTKDSTSTFNPPPQITHFTPSGCKVFCEYDRFSSEYINPQTKNSDYWFYLGYYVHLITDVLWSASVYMPTRFKYAEEYKKNREFIKTIKKDWYNLDFEFLFRNPNFEPYRILCEPNDIKDYLPFYETGQLRTQLCCIAQYYKNTEYDPNFRYAYLTESEAERFIHTAVDLITAKINF